MTITITKWKLALATIAVALIAPTTAVAFHIFDDVPDDKFYADAVEWAFDNGITTGRSPTIFDPDAGVTRGESVTFDKRYDDNIVQPALAGLQTEVDTNEADIDAIEALDLANQLPIAVSVADTNVDDPAEDTFEVILSATIEVPVAGLIQAVGSVFVQTLAVAPDTFSCRLTDGAGATSNLATDDFDDTDRQVEVAGANEVGFCATNGATAVDAGTHVINLVARQGEAGSVMDDATLDLLFIAGSGNSFTALSLSPQSSTDQEASPDGHAE